MSIVEGFPHSSVGKESTCNAGDPRLIPGSERSTGEGKGYPLQYSWASLVAQLVKNLPAMRKIWVRSLGWEDPLEKGKATHSSILAWRILWKGAWRAMVHRVTEDATERRALSLSIKIFQDLNRKIYRKQHNPGKMRKLHGYKRQTNASSSWK